MILEYPSDYPRTREEAIQAARSIRDEDIDYSDIPEVTDFSGFRPAAERFRKMAERNLARRREREQQKAS